MSKLAREDQGFVLVTAIILLAVMLGFGVAVVAFTNSQQKASSHEQYSEAAFNLAEAALNAQIGQLSRKWPGSVPVLETKEIMPKTCASSTPSSKENLCPEPAILEKTYPNTGSTCSGNEAWGSPLSNKWDTYVRKDLGGSPYFNSTEEDTNAQSYASTTEKLWVRAVGVVNCHAVSVVSLVSEQTQHATFPEGVLTANWFKTGNSGKKPIINRKGTGSQNGKFNIRCEPPRKANECEEYNEGQIEPPLLPEEEKPSSVPSTTLTSAQIEELKSQAESEGHFYSTGKCPESIGELSGKPTYIEGCGSLKFTSKESANTEAVPGFLLLANGTIEFGGSTTFYGEIYCANLQATSEALVKLKGSTKILGGIVVDGAGGVEIGEAGKEHIDLEYSSTAVNNFEVITNAAATRNSFRILPSGQ